MKKLSPYAGKALFLVLLGFIGYEIKPIVFPLESMAEAEPKVAAEPKQKPVSTPVARSPIVQKMQQNSKRAKETPVTKLGNSPAIPKEIKAKRKGKPKSKPVISPLDSASLLLVGNNASSKAQLENDEKLLDHAIYHGEWVQYRALLWRALSEEYQKVRFDKGSRRYEKLWSEPKFYNALLRWQVLGKFKPATLKLTKSLAGSAAMLTWVMTNNTALEESILTSHKKDNTEKAFRFLAKVWQNKKISYQEKILNPVDKNNEKLHAKYFNLALACALVFDKPVSYRNPTSNGSIVDGYFRYHWYRYKNEKGLLEGDIHRSSAKDLTFVVCSPVSTSELEWALKKYRSTRRKNIGKAFSDVEYLMERAVDGLNPYAEYTLPEILKEGGICGDQTYFCVNTARAAGIPAFGLSGITNSGGHAWAAVKLKDDEWSTKTGRIGGVSKGKGRSPQTGKSIIEQEVWMWSERKHASRDTVVKIFRNVWLADFFASIENVDEEHHAIILAHNMGEEFPTLWKKVYRLMLKDGNLMANPALKQNLDTWRKFVKEFKHQFRDNPRMSDFATEIEDKHIFPHAELADSRRALARLRRRNTKNAEEQADLQTQSLRRESKLILAKAGDQALNEIHQLYSQALREYGGSISGFQEMIQYYFSVMKKDEKMAKKAVRTIELAFNRVVDTGSGDWFRLKAEVGIHKKIAAMYREIGEEKRAKNMEKRLERIMKNAKRKAL